ncbi:hypothetical protein [Telmatospirillum siberiense]|nr:hypothetical protein [Telmatospirillum siberiense]
MLQPDGDGGNDAIDLVSKRDKDVRQVGLLVEALTAKLGELDMEHVDGE